MALPTAGSLHGDPRRDVSTGDLEGASPKPGIASGIAVRTGAHGVQERLSEEISGYQPPHGASMRASTAILCGPVCPEGGDCGTRWVRGAVRGATPRLRTPTPSLAS
jgi:hypothetical protein